MNKVRVHEIAKELATRSKEIIEKAVEMGLSVKSANSTLTMEEAEKLMNFMMNNIQPKAKDSVKDRSDKKDVPKEEKQSIITKEKIEQEVQPKKELGEKRKEKVEAEKEVKKEDTKSKDQITNPNKSTSTTKTTMNKILKVHSPTRRKGLTIVKKRRPIVEPIKNKKIATIDKSLLAIGSYGKMSQEAKEELVNKKKGNKRHYEIGKKKYGQKIDFAGSSFGGVGYDIEQEQVQLIDYRDEQAKIDLQQQVKKEQQEQLLRKTNAKKQNKGNQRKNNYFHFGAGISRNSKKRRRRNLEEEITHVKSIEIPEDIRVYEFASKINKNISEVIGFLFNLGMMVTKNDFLGKDEIEILAQEFEVEVHTVNLTEAFDLEKDYEAEIKKNKNHTIERAPIVAIMGHVDHGKTTLLDYIRSSRVALKERGGITQHIGAYFIEKNGKKITFLDTPGHEAFSAMRSRGADITDIIIIVVAADDGVKPQTIESIKHAKESSSTIIVAINKMDKDGANPDLVKSQMAEHGLTPTDWGGTIDFIPLSAKSGEGVESLLSTILDNAEILELKATPNLLAKATVVESSIEKGRGPVATVVVQNGTLKVGSFVVSGPASGRTKLLLDYNKKSVKSIGPSGICIVVGLDKVPASGEILIETKTEKEARELANKRHEHDRHKELSISTKTSLDELSALIAEGNLKALKVILKADVHGSLEAIRTSLETLRNDEVKIQIISSSVGGITQTDVDLADNSENTIILGFNVRPTGKILAFAKQKGVEIKTYSIIYDMLNDMTAMLSGMMSKIVKEENTGQAIIKEVFTTPKGVKIAGCMVESGKVVRGGKIRVIREGVVLHVTTILSLRRFKDEVKDVSKGYECGIMLDKYEDIQIGDTFETFIEVKESASL